MLHYCRKFEDVKFNIFEDMTFQSRCIFFGTPGIGETGRQPTVRDNERTRSGLKIRYQKKSDKMKKDFISSFGKVKEEKALIRLKFD